MHRRSCTGHKSQCKIRADTVHHKTKLDFDNGIEYDEAEERTGNAVADFESYFGVQKKVFEQAA